MFKSRHQRKIESLVSEFRYQLLIPETAYQHVKTTEDVRQYMKGQRDQLQTVLYELEESFNLPHYRKQVSSEASSTHLLLGGFHAK